MLTWSLNTVLILYLFLILLPSVYASPNPDLLAKDTALAIALVSNIICEVCMYQISTRKEKEWFQGSEGALKTPSKN